MNELGRLVRCAELQDQLDRAWDDLERNWRRWPFEQRDHWLAQFDGLIAEAQRLVCAGTRHGLVEYDNGWHPRPSRYRDVALALPQQENRT